MNLDIRYNPMNPRASQLVKLIRPFYLGICCAFISLLLSMACSLAFPLAIARLLDATRMTGARRLVDKWAILLFLIFTCQAIFSFLQSYLLSIVGERITSKLRVQLYSHLQGLSHSFLNDRRIGELVSRLSNDVSQIRSLLSGTLVSSLSQVTLLIGAVVIIFAISPQLSLFMLLTIGAPLIFFSYFFGRQIEFRSVEVQDELARSLVIAEEGLYGFRVVKGFGRESYEVMRFEQSTGIVLRAASQLAAWSSSFSALMVFSGFGAIGAIMWYAGREVIAGQLSLGMITGFLMYAVMIAGSLVGLSGLYGQLRSAIGGVQRVFQILDIAPEIVDAPGAVTIPPINGKINFENVSFRYNSGTLALKDITLEIRPGETFAFVGPTGAGKSTLLNLIPRFYDPTHGTIRIDGIDLREATQLSFRSQIGIVPQETMLFGGSIKDNILYGRLDATEFEIISAAKAANAHDFIMQLAEGYNSPVGEAGMSLSGGQRQCIAIARAILKNPRILLLDEATSALDNESESLVRAAINGTIIGRTTVIIAHRLSTITAADRIAVLSDGRIAELGSHDQLLQESGLYARLYDLQFRS